MRQSKLSWMGVRLCARAHTMWHLQRRSAALKRAESPGAPQPERGCSESEPLHLVCSNAPHVGTTDPHLPTCIHCVHHPGGCALVPGSFALHKKLRLLLRLSRQTRMIERMTWLDRTCGNSAVAEVPWRRHSRFSVCNRVNSSGMKANSSSSCIGNHTGFRRGSSRTVKKGASGTTNV